MSKKYDAKLFQELSLKHVISSSENLDFPQIFLKSISDGISSKTQSLKIEYKRFDEEWLNNLETFYPSLLEITKNLKSSLKYEEEILPVEKTRRTNTESIRHLLRNTRYISDVTENGEIIPEKVLNTLSEVEYGIYENRFIMTLIDRLYHFMLKRIEVIRENVLGNKEMNFNMSNKFDLGNTKYELDIKIKANEDIDIKELDIHNYSIYEKANEDFKIVSRMYHSSFMKTMKKYRKVKAPILKTQIILKNPNFRNAYLLWLYLDRLHVLDFTLERKTRKVIFEDKYIDQIDKSLIMLFSTVLINSDVNEKNSNLISENIKPVEEQNLYLGNVDIKPTLYDLEPNLATEYQLKKLKQSFNRNYQEMIRNENAPEVALKQILLDQYSIADQVYNYYFETDQDEDVFNKLININNPVNKFNESLKRYQVTKSAREVKEELYQKALKLEEKWIKEANNLQKEALNYLKNKEISQNTDLINKLEKELNKELNLYNKELITKNKVIFQNERKKNIERNNADKKEYRDKLKSFREKETLRLKKEQEKLKELKIKEKARIKEKNLKEKQKELEKAKIKRLKEREALKIKLAKEKDKIKLMNQKKLENFKNKIK